MSIETIDDIVNDIADKLGVYGACKSESDEGCLNEDGSYNNDPCCCRVGFTMVLTERIYRAIANENQLKKIQLI